MFHQHICIDVDFLVFLLYFSVNFFSYISLILLFQKVPALEVHLLSPERKWALSYKWVVVKALGGAALHLLSDKAASHLHYLGLVLYQGIAQTPC